MKAREETSDSIRGWMERIAGGSLSHARVERRPLRGGIEAPEVGLVTIRYRDVLGRPRILRYVSKRLSGRAVREAVVHSSLVARYAADLAPRLLAVEFSDWGDAWLCLEAIQRVRAWPWRDLSAVRDVLDRLARFHQAAADGAALVPEWDYDAAIRVCAEETRFALAECAMKPDLSSLAKYRRPLDRIVLALPQLRSQLLSERPFGAVPIHGDVHTGNALVRRRGRREEAVLLDWGRARIGSPLEDVSSWLWSLGSWENGVRQRHDTLLAAYLSARGFEQKLTSQVRAAYWMAGASNALAGAVLHHLSIAADERESTRRRRAAARSAQDWLRVVRRADAWRR
jgi:hypothetical protein